jgi:FkbM family methyltransferase
MSNGPETLDIEHRTDMILEQATGGASRLLERDVCERCGRSMIIKRAIRRAIENRGFYFRRRKVLPYGVDFMNDVSRIASMAGSEITSFFDIGASRGEISRSALSEFPLATVTAFEPNPNHSATLARLCRQAARFSFHQIALGETDGAVSLFLNEDTRESTVFQDDNAPAISVPQLTLDSFCRDQQVDRIDVLKIDAEGAEMAILRGAGRTLSARGVRFVYCEFFNDGRGTSLRALLDFLEPRDFRLVATSTENVARENGHIFACANALFFRR